MYLTGQHLVVDANCKMQCANCNFLIDCCLREYEQFCQIQERLSHVDLAVSKHNTQARTHLAFCFFS